MAKGGRAGTRRAGETLSRGREGNGEMKVRREGRKERGRLETRTAGGMIFCWPTSNVVTLRWP